MVIHPMVEIGIRPDVESFGKHSDAENPVAVRPDRWDVTGAAICLVGAAVIVAGPR